MIGIKGFKEECILAASNRLFLENGYESTTMRQIAEAAGVSLGLATYHFSTKRQIAVTILEKYLRYLRDKSDDVVPPLEEPLLHSALMVRVSIEFFFSPAFRRFYIECLSNDIYAESIQRLGNRAMNEIARCFAVDLSSDLSLLFDNYIPPSVEKILILEKARGHFPSISYELIPDIVFSVSVERHLDKAVIDEASKAALPLARRVLALVPPDISELLFPTPIEA